jgi:transcriptional regulator with XRE-family HTH domain
MKKIRRERLANHLWKYRHRMGYSQSDVAEIMGFSNSSQICQWEKGVMMSSLENVIKLSVLYRAPVLFLFYPWYTAIKKELRDREEEWRYKTGYYQKIQSKR